MRERLVVRAEPLDLHAIDGKHAHVGHGANACGSLAVLREQRDLADHLARPELTRGLGSLDLDRSFEDDVEPRTPLSRLDEHLPTGNHRLGANRLERLQVVGIHHDEYANHERTRPVGPGLDSEPMRCSAGSGYVATGTAAAAVSMIFTTSPGWDTIAT